MMRIYACQKDSEDAPARLVYEDDRCRIVRVVDEAGYVFYIPEVRGRDLLGADVWSPVARHDSAVLSAIIRGLLSRHNPPSSPEVCTCTRRTSAPKEPVSTDPIPDDDVLF